VVPTKTSIPKPQQRPNATNAAVAIAPLPEAISSLPGWHVRKPMSMLCKLNIRESVGWKMQRVAEVLNHSMAFVSYQINLSCSKKCNAIIEASQAHSQ
jgi:hypothetical protein